MTEESAIPLVSIIIRTQGRRLNLLKRALSSVVSQTYLRLEIIVVEDGSEHARSAVDAASADFRGAFIYKSVAKCGRCEAGNVGLNASNGDFLGFLDEDDELYPDHVERLISALVNAPTFRLAYAQADVEFCNGLMTDQIEVKKRVRHDGMCPFSRTELWLSNRFPIQAALFHRSMFEEYGGFAPELDCFEDWDLWLRYSATEDFLAVDACTSLYRMPAAKESLKARAALHDEWLPRLREKHKMLKGVHSFTNINELPDMVREAIPFRHAVNLAAAALLRRVKI